MLQVYEGNYCTVAHVLLMLLTLFQLRSAHCYAERAGMGTETNGLISLEIREGLVSKNMALLGDLSSID